jgi:CheY-like chemotaxis protein
MYTRTTDDGGRSRLLVADDDPAFRRAVSFLLQGSGYEVTEAADGREAIHALDAAWWEERPYEIALLDIRMHGATGWEILRHALDQAPPGGAIPRVVLVTGHIGESDFARARREGPRPSSSSRSPRSGSSRRSPGWRGSPGTSPRSGTRATSSRRPASGGGAGGSGGPAGTPPCPRGSRAPWGPPRGAGRSRACGRRPSRGPPRRGWRGGPCGSPGRGPSR